MPPTATPEAPKVAETSAVKQFLSVDLSASVLETKAMQATRGEYPEEIRGLSPQGLPYAVGAQEEEVTLENKQVVRIRKDVNQFQKDWVFGFWTPADYQKNDGIAQLYLPVKNDPGNAAAKFVPQDYFGPDGFARRGAAVLGAARGTAMQKEEKTARERSLVPINKLQPRGEREDAISSEVKISEVNG